jgi:ferredoxin-type protein NapH
LGTLEVTLAGRGLIWNLVPGFIVLCLLMALLGRMWCGWVCPAQLAGHAVDNACSFIAPGAAKSVKTGWRKTAEKISGRLSRTHVLGFVAGLLIGACIFQYPLWSIICPLGVVSRTLIESAVHLSPRWELVFLVFPVLATLLFRFGWKCACPVGLIYGAISTTNRTMIPGLSPKPKKPCNECSACHTACPVGLYPIKEISTFDCTKCLRCVEHCPRKALSVRLMPSRRFNKKISS